MKSISKKTIFAISIALIGLIWISLIVAYSTLLNLASRCLTSVISMVLSIIIVELYLLVFKRDSNNQSVETGAIGIISTICFLFVIAVINTIFIFKVLAILNWIVLAINLTVDVIYIGVIVSVEQYVTRLNKQLIYAEQKKVNSKEIARKLGELLSIADDVDVKERLLKLKEAVDYSTNISTYATSDIDIKMQNQLDELVQLMLGQADKMIIIEKLTVAEKTWKMRSNTASM